MLSRFFVVIHAYCVQTAISLCILSCHPPIGDEAFLLSSLCFHPVLHRKNCPLIGASATVAAFAEWLEILQTQYSFAAPIAAMV